MSVMIGTLVYAGDLEINGESISGCALDIDREVLANTPLPLYRRCVVITLEEFENLMKGGES